MPVWWKRLVDAVDQANAPRTADDVDPVDKPRAGSRRAQPAAAPMGPASRYPDVAPPPQPPLVHMNAEEVLAQGDVVAPGPRTVRQPEPGRHTWVIALWYAVDPLELQNGGRFSLLPDQVIGTLPPTCYFCEVSWSYQVMRLRCPGQPPKEQRR